MMEITAGHDMKTRQINILINLRQQMLFTGKQSFPKKYLLGFISQVIKRKGVPFMLGFTNPCELLPLFKSCVGLDMFKVLDDEIHIIEHDTCDILLAAETVIVDYLIKHVGAVCSIGFERLCRLVSCLIPLRSIPAVRYLCNPDNILEILKKHKDIFKLNGSNIALKLPLDQISKLMLKKFEVLSSVMMLLKAEKCVKLNRVHKLISRAAKEDMGTYGEPDSLKKLIINHPEIFKIENNVVYLTPEETVLPINTVLRDEEQINHVISQPGNIPDNVYFHTLTPEVKEGFGPVCKLFLKTGFIQASAEDAHPDNVCVNDSAVVDFNRCTNVDLNEVLSCGDLVYYKAFKTNDPFNFTNWNAKTVLKLTSTENQNSLMDFIDNRAAGLVISFCVINQIGLISTLPGESNGTISWLFDEKNIVYPGIYFDLHSVFLEKGRTLDINDVVTFDAYDTGNGTWFATAVCVDYDKTAKNVMKNGHAALSMEEVITLIKYRRKRTVKKGRKKVSEKTDFFQQSSLCETVENQEQMLHVSAVGRTLQHSMETVNGLQSSNKAQETQNQNVNYKDVHANCSKVADQEQIQDNLVNSNELQFLLENLHSSLLVLDVRSKKEFKKSHIDHPSCINVPSEILRFGITTPEIENLLSAQSVSKWKNREYVDNIIIVDNGSKILPGSKIMILWDALMTDRLKCTVKILEHGYSVWSKYYHLSLRNTSNSSDGMNRPIRDPLKQSYDSLKKSGNVKKRIMVSSSSQTESSQRRCMSCLFDIAPDLPTSLNEMNYEELTQRHEELYMAMAALSYKLIYPQAKRPRFDMEGQIPPKS